MCFYWIFLMLSSELDYPLPAECIAQSPTERRDQSRLLRFDRKTHRISHHFFHELPDILPSNLSILRNDVSVLKARLPGQRQSGGRVECLLLRPSSSRQSTWRCLLKPGGKTAKSRKFGIKGEYSAEVIESLPSGEYLVRFDLSKDSDPSALAERLGTMPLPPYVRRPTSSHDEERYQTIYSKEEKRSAVAAPTAGLHFTAEILDRLSKQGHHIYDLTLSIGLGTFRPIETEKVEDHSMHGEEYFLEPATKFVLRDPTCKKLAIGTTCVRAIEHYLAEEDSALERVTQAEARLFIRPPYQFIGVDHLLTNFHLPGSTLLCLVAAFLSPGESDGLSTLKEIYAEAIAKNYRFFSYGDAMVVV